MNERIRMRYTVALQGLSEFERSALASFFRLAQGRVPGYDEAASIAASDFILADADHPADVAAVRAAERLQDCVFIGAQAPPGAAACLPRPIEPTHIVRELDQLVEARLALLDAPHEIEGTLAPAPQAARDGHGKDVLVVDDSRIALRFLQVRLQGLGYSVHVAASAAQAMERLAAQPYALVFLDISLGESQADGLALCQHIKQRAAQPGSTAPAVVLIAGHGSSADRVRAQLAGSDAYLAKPLMEDEFVATLRRLDPDFSDS